MDNKTHIIDASGKPLGRLASEIAQLLRGKQRPDFVPYKESGDIVIVKNVKKITLSGKKASTKTYFSHSGYPHGEKQTAFKKVFERKPSEVLRRAVLGMLPKNKLTPRLIRKLRFED
jgi:large subunit ribosomal protein L13